MNNTPTQLYLQPAELLRVEGDDRIDLLHRLSTQDLRNMQAGDTAQTILTTKQGKMIDWLRLLAFDDHLLMATSPGRAAAVQQWLERYIIVEDVRCAPVSEPWMQVFAIGEARPHPNVRWLQGPAPGWHLGFTASQDAIDDIRAHATVIDDIEAPRIEAGIPSAAHEFSDEINPLELRLAAHAISFSKGCYIGQEVIARLDSYDKLARVLMGFEIDAPAKAAPEMRITCDGKPAGKVTSYAINAHGRGVGLAIVKREYAQPRAAELVSDAATHPIRLVDRPFWS